MNSLIRMPGPHACRIFIAFALAALLHLNASAQQRPAPRYYYTSCDTSTWWLCSSDQLRKAIDWIRIMEASDSVGLDPAAYQPTALLQAISRLNRLDSAEKAETDDRITRMVLMFIRHLQQGNVKLGYDEVLPRHDSVFMKQLRHTRDVRDVSLIYANLDCRDRDYLVLKRYLNDSLTAADTLKRKAVAMAMNYRRYFSFLHPDEYVVANVPAAEALYIRNDSIIIRMRTVVGRTKTRTPLFASYITDIETYPFWNVPRSIAVKEILPETQKNPAYLEQNNFEVVDAKGREVDDSQLRWDTFTPRNFPYYFRQSTGPDNALGVLKFNLRNPYSVFLHATCFQGAFAKDYRFLSHGCVRLEKPFDLAHEISRGAVNAADLKSGKTKERRRVLLRSKVPAFVVYIPVKVVNGRVVFLHDEYGLVQ